MSKLVAIVGPTASGKSELAVGLAEQFNGEIVCADSRSVYIGMDLGTAKPSKEQQRRVRHHLLDIVRPDEAMSAADFKLLAQAAIREISGRGKLPFLVGGSGLYVDSVLFDYQFPDDLDHRSMVQLANMSDHELLAILEHEDPEALADVDIHNRRRVIRAIQTAGQPRSKSDVVRPQTLVLGLGTNKDVAQQRMTARIEKMLGEGFLDEASELGKTYGWGSEAMTGMPYRIFSGVILGSKSIEQGKAELLKAELGLWKRQMTWFRRNHAINWLADAAGAEKLVAEFMVARV